MFPILYQSLMLTVESLVMKEYCHCLVFFNLSYVSGSFNDLMSQTDQELSKLYGTTPFNWGHLCEGGFYSQSVLNYAIIESSTSFYVSSLKIKHILIGTTTFKASYISNFLYESHPSLQVSNIPQSFRLSVSERLLFHLHNFYYPIYYVLGEFRKSITLLKKTISSTYNSVPRKVSDSFLSIFSFSSQPKHLG